MAARLDDMDEGFIHGRAVTPLMTDSRWRADGYQAAPVLDHDAVAVFRFFHEMGCDDNRCSPGSQTGNLPSERTAGQRIYAACRFVEKQDGRIMQQGGCHGQPLFVAAGQRAGGHGKTVIEVKLPGDGFDAFLQFVGRKAVRPAEEAEIFIDGQGTVERKFLGDISDIGTGSGTGGTQIDPVYGNGAR